MKVGVTAASGNLGHVIIEALIDQIGADNVVAVARSPEKVSVPGVDKRRADYRSRQDFVGALQGLDSVIIVSSPAGPEDRVAMHRNVIAGAVEAGVRKLGYTSVIGNGREQETRYAPTAAINRQTEQDIEASGLDWVVGRNGLYLEFDVAHIVNAAAEGVFRNNGGAGPCCYMTRDEMAYAWAQLAIDDAHNGRIFNLVGEAKTQAELVAIVNGVYGIDVAYETIADEECFAKLEPVRGELVADMLTGCYQSIRNGAFDVPSDYERAAGRPPKSIKEQVEDIKAGSD